jgi:hypothetical protein
MPFSEKNEIVVCILHTELRVLIKQFVQATVVILAKGDEVEEFLFPEPRISTMMQLEPG